MRVFRFTLASLVALALVSVLLVAGHSLVPAAQGRATTAPAVHSALEQAPAPPPPPAHTFPAPTNLQVLPKDLTGEQVHEIMEQWEGDLGASCKTCHAEDRKNLAPNGRPRLNFADDSKEEKQTARKMFKMTEDINVNYVSKIDSSGAPVTCGTCHRGHLGPEPFTPAGEKDHDH